MLGRRSFYYYVNLEKQISTSLSYAIPILLFSAFTLYSLYVVFQIYPRPREEIRSRFNSIKTFTDENINPNPGLKKNLVYILCSAIFLSGLFLLYYPFILNNFNVKSNGWGDMTIYVSNLQNLSNHSLSQIFSSSMMHSDRPLSIIILWSLLRITGYSPENVVKMVPFIVYPFLIMGTYFSAKQIYGRTSFALTACYFMATGYQILLGMAHGLISNLLALPLLLVFIGNYVQATKRKLHLIAATITMLIVRYTHSYTGVLLISVVAFSLMVQLIRYTQSKRGVDKIKVGLIVVLANAVPIVYSILTRAGGNGAGRALHVASENISLENAFKYFRVLNGVTQFGFEPFNNSVITVLFLFSAALFLIKKNENLSFLAYFAVVSFLLTILGNFTITLRTLYDFPMQLLSPPAIHYLYNKFNGKASRIIPSKYLLIAYAAFFNANYALRFGFRMSRFII
jgi:hypothetical protein